jgi:hypothetical protein
MANPVHRIGLIAFALLGLACMLLAVAQAIPSSVGWILLALVIVWTWVQYGLKRTSGAEQTQRCTRDD